MFRDVSSQSMIPSCLGTRARSTESWSTEFWSTEEPPAGLGQAVLNSDRSVSALQVCYPEESMFDML